jgi:hypothetical protein
MLCRIGVLEEVPKGSLTIEDLLEKSEDKIATIIYVIENGQLHLVPKKLLTDEVLSQYDSSFKEAYYVAAVENSFNEIPKELITEKVLTQVNSISYEPRMVKLWEALLKNKNMDPILPFLDTLMEDTSGGEGTPFLHIVTKNGLLDKIPNQYLTEERVFKKTVREENLIHMAGAGGNLEAIPKEFLTNETMNLLTYHKKTPLHLAAEHGTLNLIPTEFLTLEALLAEDQDGTVFQKAAKHDCLDQIPKEFLKEEYLSKESQKDHFNCFQLAAKNRAFKNFPEEFLTEKNFMGITERSGKSEIPLCILCDTYNRIPNDSPNLKPTEKAFKKLLSKVDLTILKDLKNYASGDGTEGAYALIQREILNKKLASEFKKDICLGI